MDVENLDKDQDYRELPDTYVIFITEKDYYKAGKPVYVIQNINLTLGLPFEDGTHILYVNGEYNDTVCTVKIGRSEVGGYTSIEDALHHKGEWCAE
jgi:hypothetical protein